MKFTVKPKKKKVILNYILSLTIVAILCFIGIIIAINFTKKPKSYNFKFIEDTYNVIADEIKKNELYFFEGTKPEVEIQAIPEPEPTPTPEPTPEPQPQVPTTPEVTPAPTPVIPEPGTSIATYVQSLHVVGIGDSIMLGAVNSLYATFPNGYFDAAVSRQIIHSYDIINYLKSTGSLGEPIVINLGANSYYNDDYKRAVIDLVDGREVFWLTVTDDYKVNINASLRALGEQIPNLHIIDWEKISAGHPEYFGADGLHLTGTGQIAYANAIYSAISNFYLQKYPELSQ